MAVTSWSSGDHYERYVGRWSRLVAPEFVRWLNVEAGGEWIDVGCGTGALTSAILDEASPAAITAVDPSGAFLEDARRSIADSRVAFSAGDAEHTGGAPGSFDVAVSGLVLNFVPDPEAALHEQRRVVRDGGVVAAYVWDYAGEMWFMRHFWEAASGLDDKAVAIQESLRFDDWQPVPMATLFAAVGLSEVSTKAIVIPTAFADFDDYWNPFLGGQGPAPSYLQTLEPEHVEFLRASLAERLPTGRDGSIPLTARAWAVRGKR